MSMLLRVTAIFDDEYWARAAEVERSLRQRTPVHRTVTPDGIPVWVITRYADVRAALTDPRLSKDGDGLRACVLDHHPEAELSGLFDRHMLNCDPPDHTRLRRLLARDFTPRRVAGLRPRLAELVDELLAALPTGTPVDLVERFAYPLPITVICELMGIPEADRAPFREWTTALMDRPGPGATADASQRMARYFTDLAEAKRREPADDLLSALVHADGERLTRDELIATAFLLIVAGHDTTVNLVGNGARHLLADPRGWHALAADPRLAPRAVEELLRFAGPLRTATHRFTTEPVPVGEVTIPAGEVVLVGLASANRDAARFAEPDALDLTRDASGHVAFGHGVHHCLGAPLARLEAELAFTELPRRFPRARLAADPAELRHRTSTLISGHPELPVVLG